MFINVLLHLKLQFHLWVQVEIENGPVSQYLEKYRQFSELCSSLSRHLANKEYETTKVAEIQIEIDRLEKLIGN